MVRVESPRFVEPFEVIVNGQPFHGFETLSINRPLTAATGSFSIDLHPDFRRGLPILPGQSVEIVARNETLLTGFVDDLSATSSRDTQSVQVKGRDKTADLVDCSADVPQFVNADLREIVDTIIEPFGLNFRASGGVSTTLHKFQTYQANPGESAFSTIERAARVVGALLFTRGDGLLAIETPAPVHAEVGIEEGIRGNLISSRLDISNVDLFRTYIVRGQSIGDNFSSGLDASAIEGTSSDLSVNRHRPLIIVAPNNVSPDTAEALAQWEATNRAARATRVVVKLPGLHQVPTDRDSPLWRINELVRVKLPTLQVEGKLLINRVTIDRSRTKGTTTTLELVREGSYVPKPEIEASDEEDAFSALFSSEALELGE